MKRKRAKWPTKPANPSTTAPPDVTVGAPSVVPETKPAVSPFVAPPEPKERLTWKLGSLLISGTAGIGFSQLGDHT
jgi:hypothetical protein